MKFIKKIIQERNNFIKIEVWVKNTKKIFLVDTGSEMSFIKSGSDIQNFKENKYRKYLVTGIGGEKVYGKTYTVPTIMIQGHDIKNVDFIEYTSKNILFKFLKVEGILGWNILRKISFSLDFIERKMAVGDHEQLFLNYERIKLKNISLEPIPIFEMFSGNNELRTMIDTGSTFSYCNDEHKFNKSYSKIQFEKKISFGINGISVEYQKILKNKEIRSFGKNLIIPSVYIEKQIKEKNYDLMLGNDFLSNKILIFDKKNNKFSLYVR